MTAYQDGLDFLYGRLNYERAAMPRSAPELRLGRVRRLLRLLGDPQDALKIVHVAGTKGKGSTSAMIAAGLSASGLRTGLFCSPHLHRLEERFAIDGVEATPDALLALIDLVRPAVERLDGPGRRGPTFFDATTAMGLLHFAREGAEAVVLEVGLGGRLDSTNVVRPLLAVVTAISHDHTRQLGSTLDAIATEKAGILKRGGLAVIGTRGDEARAAIARAAKARRARLRMLDLDYVETYEPPPRPLTRPAHGRASARTWLRDWGPIELPLAGRHQAQNAATAFAALDALAEIGLPIDPERAEAGIARLRFPARVERLGERPWLVVDGAHNVASAHALAETLRECYPRTSRTLIFGTTRDKDLDGQLSALLPHFDRVVITKYLENPRAMPPEAVAESVTRLGGPTPELAPDPASAVALARRRTPPEGLIVVTGSMFLAAEARAAILAERADILTSSTEAATTRFTPGTSSAIAGVAGTRAVG